MADNLPVNFPIPTEGAVASYSYEDLASGLGFTRFYFVVAASESEVQLILTDDSSLNSTLYWTGTSGLNYLPNNDSPFDFNTSIFNSTRTIGGTAHFQGEWEGMTDPEVHLTIKHYDGTTETNISSKVQARYITGATEFGSNIDITEKTFKKGDTLRIEVETAGSSVLIQGATLRFSITIPFKIEN